MLKKPFSGFVCVSGKTGQRKRLYLVFKVRWHAEDSVFPKAPIVCVPSVECWDY